MTHDAFYAFRMHLRSDFSVEAILRAEPDLRSKAVAVVEGKPPLEKISASNEAARSAGIVQWHDEIAGASCATTWFCAIDRSCRRRCASGAARLRTLVFAARGRFQLQTCFCWICPGWINFLVRCTKLLAKISRRAADMGVEINVAVASTLESALLAAHGFSGVTIVPEEKKRKSLGGLPVEVLFAAES